MKPRIGIYIGFACASVPLILYSIYRTGYQASQFISNQPLQTLWQPLLLVVMTVVALSFVPISRTLAFVAGIFTAAAGMTFVNLSVFSGWSDDKLWVYLIAPFLFWAFLLAAAITALVSLLFERKRR
jgi:hypothetical protein